jgi:chromosome segregation protein
MKKLSDLLKLKEVSFKSEIESLQASINEVNQEYVSVRTKKEQLAELLSSNANKREDILERIASLEFSITAITPELHDIKTEFEDLELELEALNLNLQSESDELSKKSAAFNQENIGYHQQLNRVHSLEQEIDFKKTAFEGSKERIEKSQSELSSIDLEIKNLLQNNEVKDDELIELYSEKEGIENGVNEAEKAYYALRAEIDETDKQIREIQKSKESLDSLIQEMQLSINEVKLKLGNLKERLSVEFEIDLDQLMADSPELGEAYVDLSESDIREIVSKTKEKLERIGPINPMAMEAYEEIKERHTFITAQRDDLIQAKNSLIDTIKEIDEVAKKTFLDAFTNIKENFVKVFRSLFTAEDDCDLKLVDPDNPLESAIEIMAKPKGKRPLTINQLSGGEKTLTATSLLFAIYLLKPAPFCIFDEVDAPLDDANIDKFNTIIQNFSKDSQFIIVTHNKRTMASTDIIYGITMIEAGISRVVPVDLRELA